MKACILNFAFLPIAAVIFVVFFVSTALAENNGSSPASQAEAAARHPLMVRHVGDGDVKAGEYEIMDLTGGVTRSLCPYGCKDRGLSSANCRAWRSNIDAKYCYVQDTRVRSGAISGMTIGGR